MPIGDIPVSPPNVGPEPPGLAEAVRTKIFGGAPAAPPDPYALSDQDAVQLLTDTMDFCTPGREPLEWRWWQKLHYYLGNQWIYWNPNTRAWEDKRLAKWIPKPVTNMIAQTVEAVMSIQAEIQPGVSARPIGESAEAIMAAQTADDLVPLLHDEHKMDEAFWDADYWVNLLGDAWLLPHWDKTAGKPQTIQMDKCADCQRVSGPEEIIAAGQKCPQCGSPNLEPALGQDGAPTQTTAQIGRGRTIVASPLEIFLPLYAQKWDLVDRLVYATWRPKHQIEDELGSDLSSKIQWTTSPEYRSLQLYRSLATFPGAPFTPHAFGGSGLADKTEGATEIHLWMKPTKKFDRGFYMRFYGEKQPVVARSEGTGPLPTMRLDGTPLWPWVHYPFRRTGGRLYSVSLVDSILRKQDQLNQNDSMIQLAMNRMGNPVWLEPKGAEVERFTGEPGLVVKYQTVGASTAKPERVSGESPPGAFFQVRDIHLRDIEELTGTYDVIKGAKPSGVEAFSALQLLVEQSRGRFTSMFKSRGKAYAGWADVAIELERRHGPTERVKNIQSPYGTWSNHIFRKVALNGPIEIRIEDGTTTPKTALGQRASIEHLNQLGLIDKANSDQAYAIFQKFGALYLAPSLDAAVKSCLREQDGFKRWVEGGLQGPPPLVRKPWHNDQVHLQENQKWMNTDEVIELIALAEQMMPGAGQLVEEMLGMHLQEHAQALMAQQMMQAGGQPGQPDAGGGSNALRSSNRESGQPPEPPQPGAA